MQNPASDDMYELLRTIIERDGGDEETRTPDPLLAKEVLSQLSYIPVTGSRAKGASKNSQQALSIRGAMGALVRVSRKPLMHYGRKSLWRLGENYLSATRSGPCRTC